MSGLTSDITEARAVRHGVLAVTFADGLQGEVDVLNRMRGPVFDAARTSEGFAKVAVEADLAARRAATHHQTTPPTDNPPTEPTATLATAH
jgi:hypothetical protein